MQKEIRAENREEYRGITGNVRETVDFLHGKTYILHNFAVIWAPMFTFAFLMTMDIYREAA